MEQAENQPDRCCSHCGTALTNETTGGLCPRCLLEMNFASRTMPGGEASPQVPPPSPEEMAERFPQFEILECLGRGGMGIVYKARQKSLDRLVAIKVLAGEMRDDPQFEARFSREARTLARLSHPNIVTVHDFGESDGMFYLVMEFIDGVNLRDVLHDGRMEPAQALAIVPEICEALQFAHDHGVVHRDIKPENILMDRDGRVKIADFGIAALVGATAERSGTPPYMAPEQEAADGTIDHRADIYALGVVFYEMLTGERPEQDPSRPSRRIEVDVRLDEIVLRALEREPARRYQTAGEFRTVVETMVASTAEPATTAQAQARGLWQALKTGKPEAEWEGRAPGWRIRCRSCGFIEHFGKYGIRMAAAGTKWTLGRCQRCRRIRIHVIEKGPVPVGQAVPAPSTNPAPAGADCQAAHSTRRGIVMVGRRGGVAVINWAGVALAFLVILSIVLAVGALFGVALHRPMTVMEMATGGCVALLLTGGALGRARSTPLERLVDLDEPPGSQAQAARFSRTAILGAIFAYIFLLTAYLKFFSEGGAGLSGFSQFLGAWTMILGYVALQQIRCSTGRLHGLGLALFDVLLFPLLVLNAGIYLGVGNLWRANPPEVSHPVGAFLAQNEFLVPLFALTLCAVVDLLIVRRAWRAANKTVHDEAPGTATPAVSPSWQSQIMFSVIVGVTVAAGIVLMRQLPKVGSWAGVPDAESSGTAPAEMENTPEETLREYTEAGFSGDVERALGFLGPPLSETRDEVKNALLRIRVRDEEDARPMEIAEWHKEGDHAVARYLYPPKIRAMGIRSKPYVILERVGGTWKVVWSAASRIDSSLADDLSAFQRFRAVDRRDPKKVARAFIEAIASGDTDAAFMLLTLPVGGDPSGFASEFSKATQGSGPLGWYEEGPYAVTHVSLLVDRPEVESYLVLKKTGEIWRVAAADASSPEVSLADDLKRFKQETIVARVMVEDLALRFLVAIREKDEKTLRELCVDRTKGWTEAVAGQFSMELRESFRQQTGEEFTMYPNDIRVEKDLAVVTCRAFREIQKELGGNILVLHFCRTGTEWKVWTARKAPESQSLDECLEQARKLAADWDAAGVTADGNGEAENTPEQAARAFMEAIRDGNFDAAVAWMVPETGMKAAGRIRALEHLAEELRGEADAGKPDLFTRFTEWYPEKRDANTGFVGTRVAEVPADDGTGRLHGLYLILSPTPDGWKVMRLDDAYSDKPLSHYVDRFVIEEGGKGPLSGSAPTVPGSFPAFGSGDGVLIWHWDMTPEPLTVYVMEDRIFHDPAPLLARLAGLYRQKSFSAVPVRLGPAGWAEAEGLKVVRELENALRGSCPVRLAVGEVLSELPLEMDDGLNAVTVPAWDTNKNSALDLDHGTLNQTKPPLSLDFSKPETLKAWRGMGFDAYVPPGSDMLMLPTLPAVLVPAPDEWEQPGITPRALMQKIVSLAGRDRDQIDSEERPVTALFANDPKPGWLLTDYGSLLLVKVGKDGDDPGALKVSWRRARQATLRGKASSLQTTETDFGPVIERVVTEEIDLDSGSLKPEELSGVDHRADALYEDPVFVFAASTDRIRLAGNNWTGLSPEQLKTALAKRLDPSDITFNKDHAELPVTLGFRTSSGRTGVLQITGFTDKPRGVKIRYKLVQAAGASSRDQRGGSPGKTQPPMSGNKNRKP